MVRSLKFSSLTYPRDTCRKYFYHTPSEFLGGHLYKRMNADSFPGRTYSTAVEHHVKVAHKVILKVEVSSGHSYLFLLVSH